MGEIIAKLGLRYRPSGQADLHAHAEALVLLGEDCADIPPPLLDEAAKRWARESKFMPKASELRQMARDIQGEGVRSTDFARDQLERHCDTLNEGERRLGSMKTWRVVGEAPHRRVDCIG